MNARFLLAPDAYTDAAWFVRERRSVFARTWQLIAHVEQLADDGDFVTATIGGTPIAVVRHPDGGLRAFHNVCRHRGMAMLEECGNTAREIECVYHGWRYDLDGALQVVPQRRAQFPELDAAECSLRPALVDVWEGMVFVNSDAAAPPLREALAELPDYIGSHRPGKLTLVGRADVPAACNWKLLVENHIDVYHLWYLHRDSLSDFDHNRFEHHQLGPNWASYEPLRVADSQQRHLTAGTAAIRDLDPRDRNGLGAHLAFPNTLMASNGEFFMSYAVVPDAPDRSHIEIRVRAELDADGEALVAAARSFIEEDVHACEQIQASLASPWFEVGPLARTHEAPITTFQQNLLDLLG
jgi:phenylpropionate dioxygenase-like ring-hydroxylating dioxygenase large terminal subunit